MTSHVFAQEKLRVHGAGGKRLLECAHKFITLTKQINEEEKKKIVLASIIIIILKACNNNNNNNNNNKEQ
ncbi:MAG: hypothetical protein ACI8RD_010127 [Bacillariaceae sp.]